MKSLVKIFSLYLVITSLIFVSCSGNEKNGLTEFHGKTMGTTYSVKVIDIGLSQDEAKKKNLKLGIDEVLVQVNNQMSTWQKDSELSQFNSSKSTGWFPVSKDFMTVVKDARSISEVSNGAYDVTVGKLVNLWGFGPTIKEDNLPLDSEIEKAKELCDYRKLETKEDEPAIKKENPDMYVDLSSIAKGFGVDKVADFIKSSGYTNYLVEIGGEVRTSGRNQTNEKWRIGISTPDGSFDIEKVISLDNVAVATSGDYRNYFEKDGVRYSHTIDPRTGKPITHNLASVTVVYDNCTMADGYATAIDVLGPEEGFELAQNKKLPVFLIVKTDEGFKEKMTPEFEELLKNN